MSIHKNARLTRTRSRANCEAGRERANAPSYEADGHGAAYALLMSTGERYIVLATNFVTTAVSRIVPPQAPA